MILREKGRGRESELDFGDALAAQLHGFQPTDGISLTGDDLGLPNEADGHKAHQEDTDRQGEVSVRLACRQTKSANEPRHVQVS